ncbi:MAG: cysteine synthase family protein [Actinomycetota bacterium]|nr:cysteine synthase family protein [Actinomycetota bacterium]
MTILDAIGNTPLVQVDGVWLKCEFLNPSGSVKARMARFAIERAEAEGRLRPGDTIVEASSGNTGNAMSMVAAVRGYRMVVVTAGGLSRERTAISRAFGAEVREVGDFHVTDARDTARRLGEQERWFHPGQFDGEWNVECNATGLGPEILRGLPSVPDVVICGIGTGGTLVGVGRAFRGANPRCAVLGVEPSGSRTLCCGEVGRHRIEGISDGFVPGIVDRHRSEIDDVVAVDDADALAETARLAREFGVFVGPSTGAHLVAARAWRECHPGTTVVTFASDEGEKYLSETAGVAAAVA